jgi:hypothetical protein
MNSLINVMAKSRLFNSDLDYHLVRASMVIIYLLFGYQKWWEYEAQTLSDGHYRQLEQYYNTHRVKLPENHTNITLSGQNGLTSNGASGSAALCLITQEWTRRISRLTGSAATGEPGDAPVTPTLGGSTRSFERNARA